MFCQKLDWQPVQDVPCLSPCYILEMSKAILKNKSLWPFSYAIKEYSSETACSLIAFDRKFLCDKIQQGCRTS